MSGADGELGVTSLDLIFEVIDIVLRDRAALVVGELSLEELSAQVVDGVTISPGLEFDVIAIGRGVVKGVADVAIGHELQEDGAMALARDPHCP